MLIFRHEAEQDIREAYAWYEQQYREIRNLNQTQSLLVYEIDNWYRI